MPRRAYSYIRFSTAGQVQGDSLRRQGDLARAWCEENGVELVEDYRDLGVSAFRGKNAAKGALRAFLARVESGKIPAGSLLLVESLDRLTRAQIVDALSLFLSIISAGVEVVTLADGKRYSRRSVNDNFSEIIISLTILSRANEESETKARRQRALWDQKRLRAQRGEIVSAKGPPWLELSGDRRRWVVVRDRARVVRWIFERAAEGWGANRIALDLNRRSVPTLTGRGSDWFEGVVSKLLRNRAAVGDFEMHRCGPDRSRELVATVRGYYPRVIPAALFERVQKIRSAPSGRRRGPANPDNIFRGLCFDSRDGSPVYCRTGRGARSYAHLIPKSCHLGKRPRVTWRLDDFRRRFLLVVRAASLAPGRDSTGDREALEAERAELSDRIANLNRVLAAAFTPEGVEELARLQSRREEIATSLSESSTQGEPEEIDWLDSERLRANIAATVRRIEIDFEGRAFRAEMHGGGSASYRETASGDVLVEVDGVEIAPELA